MSRTLWAHQRRMVDFAKDRSAVIFAADMGVGKTFSAIVTLSHHWNPKLVLIVCPKSIVAGVWPREFEKSGVDWRFECLTQKSIPARIERARAAGREWTQDGKRGVLAYVMNYESLRNEKMVSFLAQVPWDVAIADEIHRCRNSKSKTARAVRKVFGSADRRMGLTGTIMAHDVGDVFGAMMVIDDTILGRSYFRFRQQYAVMGGYKGYQITGWRDTEQLMERCSNVIIRVTEEEANLDIPESRDETVLLDMGNEASSAYKKLEADAVAQVASGTITASNGLVKLLRLCQLTSGVAVTQELDELGDVVSQTETVIDTAKMDYLVDLFTDSPGKPIVVFGNFKADLAATHKAAAAVKVKSLELSGARNELKEWQAGEAPILAVQITAGSEGVDFTRANRVVFMSTGLKLYALQQAKKRAHRPGQKNPVLNTFLACRGTVDETIARSLAKREDLIDGVLAYLSKKCNTSASSATIRG